MIQAITFDLWNTIFTNKSYSEQRLQHFFKYFQNKELFIPFDKLKITYNEKFHFSEVTFEEIEYRHIYTKDRILNVLRELKIEISKEDLESIKQDFESMMLHDPPSLIPGVKNTLEELAPRYKIGLISNTGVTPGRILSKVLEEHNILHFFDVAIFSDETGYFKPHPIMFKITLEKLGCHGENAIHIGDMLETDIKGANEYKMLSIWYNESNQPRSVEITPAYEIKEISEVINIIRGI